MFKIREAKREDVPYLLEIYNNAVLNSTATFDIHPVDIIDRLDWFEEHKGIHPLTVADVSGRAVAYCSLSTFRQKDAYRTTVENSVYVHPDFRGKGIGKALMTDMIQRAKDLGIHSIIAGITSGNDISIKMHEDLGFKFCGEFHEVGIKFDKYQNVKFYELLL